MNLLRLSFAITSIIFVTACGPRLTDENADDVSAKVLCKKHKQCDTPTWDNYDADMSACRDAIADTLDDVRDFVELFGASVDLEELDACLSDIRAAECDAFARGDVGNDCADVFGF